MYVANKLKDIIQVGKKVQSRVVQKYIEKTYLIKDGTKFDVRQWVLVTSWDPLEAYIFDSSYLRLCSSKFSLTDISDIYRHLSNYAVQKTSETGQQKPNYCWSIEEFEAFISE